MVRAGGHIKAGKLEGLAVTHAKRSPAPAADVKEALSAFDVRGELQALIEKDRLRYGRIIREKNLRAE